jgi:hypothetical protein
MHTRPIALLLLIALLPAIAQAQPVTPEEINPLIADANYKDALQKIAGALALRGEAGKKVDRHQLYMLKAECHLRMKAPTMAIESYVLAAKEATDDKARNLAAAHELLMRRQRGLAYKPTTQPKGQPPVTIDILNPDNRKKAFAALYGDEVAALQPRLAAAKKSTSLVPLFELFKQIPKLEGIESAANSPADSMALAPVAADAPQTQKLLADLGEQSRKLIETSLRDTAKRVAAIDKEVNQFQEIVREVIDPTVRSPFGVRYKMEKAYKKVGPNDAHLKELQNITTTGDQVAQAARMLAEGVPAQARGFETLITETDRIKKEVERILDADYTTVYKDLPTKPPRDIP